MMKRYLLALSILTTSAAFGADLVVTWVNSADNPIPTQTVVSYGGVPNIYTNSVTVAYGVTNVTLTNLPPGRRIYVAARAFNGLDYYSAYSNEDSGNTKLNAPKNLTVTP